MTWRFASVTDMLPALSSQSFARIAVDWSSRENTGELHAGERRVTAVTWDMCIMEANASQAGAAALTRKGSA